MRFHLLIQFTLVKIAIGSDNLRRKARYILAIIVFNAIVELRENAKGMRSKRSEKPPNIHVRFALETT